MREDIPYLLALNHIPLLGSKRLGRLHTHFTSWANIWQASESELAPLLEPSPLNQLLDARKRLIPEQLFLRHERLGITLLPQEDSTYPSLLKQIPDAPPLLFVRGTPPPADALLVSIVGTRTPSPYGKIATAKLVESASTCMAPIVSGLAFGIDITAHQQALKQHLPTIAILPGGIDNSTIVPSAHLSIAHSVLNSGGCLLSEKPAGTLSHKSSYPIRNRLIAGIAHTTAIVEARLASGSMITASLATQYNRTLLAVPGPITSPLSEGPNTLIHQGARPFLGPKDLQEAIGWRLSTRAPIEQALTGPIHENSPFLSSVAVQLLQVLPATPCLLDDLITEAFPSMSDLLSASMELEMAGKIRSLPGGFLERIA